jgi:hypothetical protein
MSDQLSPGDSCLVDVNPKKGFDRRPDWQPGVIKEPVGKGYMVLLDSQLNDSLVEPQWYPAKIVKPGRKVTALSDMTAKEFVARAQQDPREVLQVTPTRQVVFNRIEMPPVPIPKPDKPEKSPAFLAFCRQRECQNPGCGTPPPNEAHHQGTGSNERGVGQKVRDTKCVTLCNYCHAIYTGGPGRPSLQLPDRQATAQEKSLVLRSKEETELILRRAQMETIREALNYLPIEKRVEVLSKALALVPEEVLEEYLPKGEIR